VGIGDEDVVYVWSWVVVEYGVGVYE